jgi:signal transduction histidine kinase
VDGFELCKLQPFYRDGTVAAFPGFGLGLPLVKRIINLHKGMIQVNSNVKTGTTFLVKLPAAFAKTDPNHLQNSTH